MTIGWAIALGAMLVLFLPRLPRILRATPKASSAQWLTALIPLVLVGAFVFVLMLLV